MKTILKLSWIVLAILVLVQTAEAQVVQVTGRTVRLRSQPTTASRLVATVHKGDKLEIVENFGTWYKVRVLSTGEVGHIHRAMVRVVQDQAVPQARPTTSRPSPPPAPAQPAATKPDAVPPAPPSTPSTESYARAQSMEEPPDSGVDFTLWGGLLDVSGSNLSGGGALSFPVGGRNSAIEVGGEYTHMGSASANFGSPFGSANVSGNSYLLTVNGSFNYNFNLTQTRLVPYTSAGLVWGRWSSSATATLPDFGLSETISTTSSETAFQFGGGVKFPVGEGGKHVRGDVRFNLFDNDTATRLFLGLVF